MCEYRTYICMLSNANNFRSSELKHFEVDHNFKVDSNHCDIIITEPAFVIKLDAGAPNRYVPLANL